VTVRQQTGKERKRRVFTDILGNVTLVIAAVALVFTVLVWVTVCAVPLAGFLGAIGPWMRGRAKYRRLPVHVVGGELPWS